MAFFVSPDQIPSVYEMTFTPHKYFFSNDLDFLFVSLQQCERDIIYFAENLYVLLYELEMKYLTFMCSRLDHLSLT